MWETLAYFDLFDYPLTRSELIKFSHIKGDSFALPKVSPYWNFLPGRESLVALCRQRLRFSQLKWQKINRFIWVFNLIPWIKLVAVTGTLSMNNVNQEDDIDLMVITQKNRLWLTRLILILVLFPFLRRGKKINNRFCLNLFLDETSLAIKAKNLYTAHEICQAKPIFQRDNMYQKFIQANLWFKNYLPNWKI